MKLRGEGCGYSTSATRLWGLLIVVFWCVTGVIMIVVDYKVFIV
jgi:hypothetical protein